MNCIDITTSIPKEKRKLVNAENLAREFEVSLPYVYLILNGERKTNTPIAKAIKEKAIKIIKAIETI